MQFDIFWLEIAYSCGYSCCACTELRASLLLRWKLSRYLDFGGFICIFNIQLQRRSFSNKFYLPIFKNNLSYDEHHNCS